MSASFFGFLVAAFIIKEQAIIYQEQRGKTFFVDNFNDAGLNIGYNKKEIKAYEHKGSKNQKSVFAGFGHVGFSDYRFNR
jgi:hypothetical protein